MARLVLVVDMGIISVPTESLMKSILAPYQQACSCFIVAIIRLVLDQIICGWGHKRRILLTNVGRDATLISTKLIAPVDMNTMPKIPVLIKAGVGVVLAIDYVHVDLSPQLLPSLD
jgi:hypothetical protein